jgi:uncharacterized protein (DUF58 family)
MTRGLNILAGVLLVASVLTRNALLFMLAALLGLVAGLSTLWDRYALAGVSFGRRLGATRLFVGEETDATLEVVNAKPLPLAWLKIEDEWPGEVELVRGKLLRSYKPTRRVLPILLSMRYYERVSKHYRLRALHRGAFELGPAQLSSGDMFGFRTQDREIPEREWLTVYPKVVPVSALGLPAAHPFGDAKTARRISDDPLRVTGVRTYAPGDSPRTIHWRATARRGELQTKVFDPGATRTAAIFLDLRTVQGFPGITPEYLELGISAAASVARYLLDQREAVGLYANGARRNEGQLVRLPASRRADQWTAILEALAWLAGLPIVSLETVLRAEMPALPFGAEVVAITSQSNEETLAALLDLQRAGHPVALLAIGEEAPADMPDALRTYWIGGREAWERLASFELAETV